MFLNLFLFFLLFPVSLRITVASWWNIILTPCKSATCQVVLFGKTANSRSLLSVWTACGLQGSQSASVLSVCSYSHSFLLQFDLFDFLFCFFFSLLCLSPGFLLGCFLTCVGDKLAQHNVWLCYVSFFVSRPALAK